MTYTLMSVSSVTYAMKAKNLLNGLGYYCEVERQNKNTRTGCGYMIRIRDDPQHIAEILERGGVRTSARTTVER